MVAVDRIRFVVPLVLAMAAGCTSQSVELPEAIRQKLRDTQVQSPYANRRDDSGGDRLASDAGRGGRVIRTRDELTTSETASVALGRIGDAAVPGLVQLLHHPQPAIRRQAVETLSRIGPAAAPAVPDLIRSLSDEDAQVRRAAARTLGQIGPAAGDAVPALLRIMQERDE